MTEVGLTRLVTFCIKLIKGKVIVRSAAILIAIGKDKARTYGRPLRDAFHLGNETESG